MKVHTVRLKIFQDDASGIWGVTHPETLKNDYSFNAFWNAIGIFHDVFEHWHEYVHPYFRGGHAMNVAGEMVASGATWYFYHEMRFYDRLGHTTHSFSSKMDYEIVKENTQDLLEEAIGEAYCSYGDALYCQIPKQRPTDNGALEYDIIREMWSRVKMISPKRAECVEEEGWSERYKQSITFRKIADTHRFGYRLAQRLVPNNPQNRQTLQGFWNFIGDFTRANDAQELHTLGVRELVVKVRKKKGYISWQVWLQMMDGKMFRVYENFKGSIYDDIATLYSDENY